MRVLCDVDGVLASYVSSVLDLSSRHFGTRLSPDDIKTWDLFEHLGLTPAQLNTLYAELNAPGFCTSIQPMPGAQRFLTELQERGYSVHIVTAPWRSSQTWMWERERWLWKHFGIAGKHVTHTAAKELVTGRVFIDDKADHVRKWQAAHPRGHALLFSAPYNEDATDLRRVRSYDEILQVIDDGEVQ